MTKLYTLNVLSFLFRSWFRSPVVASYLILTELLRQRQRGLGKLRYKGCQVCRRADIW